MYIWCFKNFCGPVNILLHIPLKMKKKMKEVLSSVYSLKLKNIMLFLTRGLIFIFFKWSCSQCFVSTLLNLKSCFENDKVVSMLTNVAQINVEIGNVDSTMFCGDVHNLVLTLSWRCAMLRRFNNDETTLKCYHVRDLRWNLFVLNFSCKRAPS